MAQKFPLLSVVWIAVAIVVSATLATATDGLAAEATTDPGTEATADPGTGSTTPDPGTGATTTDPGTEATADPGTGSTTPDPGTGSTTPDPGTGATTADPGTGATTADPGTGATTPVPGTEATTPDPDPCAKHPCRDGSTCEARFNETFVCSCIVGDNYNYDSKTCESAKVFPTKLVLSGRLYEVEMSDKTSEIFQEISEEIITQLIIPDGTYTKSIVQELSPVLTRTGASIRASVEIIFSANSEITTAKVLEQVKAATECDNCILKDAAVTEENLCDKTPCDPDSTNCKSSDGSFTCGCKSGYIPTSFGDRMCTACPSGYKAVDSKCIHCAFGRSGFNCDEEWKLVLVIVGSVLGGLLLITLILLPIVARKSSKKGAKKSRNADTGKSYVSQPATKAPLANTSVANSQAASFNEAANGRPFPNAGVPRIPRATTNSSWDNRTNLEMTPSNSRQNLIPAGRNSRLNDDQDDMNPYIRPQSSHYAQTRPQNNPYAQNRPKINPYAQSQGHSNHYYDDGRRY